MKTFPLVGGIVLVVLIGAGIYYASTHRMIPSTSSASGTSTPAAVSMERTPPTGFREYHSATYHFSLFYPDTLLLKEYAEPGTARTLTFESSEGDGKEFQIFIVPYGEKTVSEARFKQDIPSGVIIDTTDIVVDGVSATMFFSTNTVMGETREVWFINHGFLYEVTTEKESDAWLAQIMQSWKFF